MTTPPPVLPPVQYQSPTPPTPGVKSSWRLPKWTAIPTLILAGLLTVRVIAGVGFGDRQDVATIAPYCAGLFVASLLVAILVSLVAFYVSRRSALVAGIAFSLLLALPIFGHSIKLITSVTDTRGQNRAAMENMLEASKNRKAEMVKELDDTGEIQDHSKLATETVQMLEDASKSMKGDEKIMMESATVIVSKVAEATKALETSLNAFIESGGADPTGLKAKSEIATRRKKLDELRTLSTNLGQVCLTAPDEVERIAKQKGLSARKAAEHKAGFAKGMRLDLQRRLRRTDTEIFDAMNKQFDILENNWGKWKATAQDGIVFEEDAPLKSYNEAVVAMQKAADEQAKVQREMLSAK